MASSKHWALYAVKHRMGQDSEHQLAGARIAQVGVYLNRTILFGWRVTFHVYRFALTWEFAPPHNDPRIVSRLNRLMSARP